MIQDELMQPRASGAFWSTPQSDGRGVYYYSIMVWCMGRGQHKGRAIFEKQLWVLFGGAKGAVE